MRLERSNQLEHATRKGSSGMERPTTLAATGRMTALAVAMLLLAVPALAAVMTQNFLRADVTADTACFTKVAGADALAFNNPVLDPYIEFDAAATVVDASSGLSMLQERLTVEGYAGDRITYTDYVHYENNCDTPLTIQLVAEPDFNGDPAKGGTWADVQAMIYISVATNGTAGTDLSGADWDSSPIVVNASAVPGSTGSVTVLPGEYVQGAIVIDADAASAGSGPYTLRYTAQAAHS